jgi:hypothetical protein
MQESPFWRSFAWIRSGLGLRLACKMVAPAPASSNVLVRRSSDASADQVTQQTSETLLFADEKMLASSRLLKVFIYLTLRCLHLTYMHLHLHPLVVTLQLAREVITAAAFSLSQVSYRVGPHAHPCNGIFFLQG